MSRLSTPDLSSLSRVTRSGNRQLIFSRPNFHAILYSLTCHFNRKANLAPKGATRESLCDGSRSRKLSLALDREIEFSYTICVYSIIRMEGEMEVVVKLMKALSDETRLRIVKLLQHKNGLCVCEIMQALGVTQTRASRNLGILRDAGFLTSKKAGLWVEYFFDEKRMDKRASALLKLLSAWLEDSKIVKEDRKRLSVACRIGPEAAARCR
jgi:ArsR family transcriptional regulator